MDTAMNPRHAVTIGLVLGVASLVWVGFYGQPTIASRSSSGTYSLPTGNPVVSGTTISSTVHNNTMADIATELTNSLDRTGRGSMSGALKLSSGSVSAPGLTFTSEPTSGLYRNGSNDVRLSIGGADLLTFKSGKLGIAGRVPTTWQLEAPDATSGDTHMQLGTTFPLFLRSGDPIVGFNIYNDGTTRYGSTHVGAVIQLASTGDLKFQTTPSGTSGAAATMTTRATINSSGLTVNSGNLAITSGTLTVGASGTPIAGSYADSYSLVVPNLTAGQGHIYFETLTGAAVGGVCIAGTRTALDMPIHCRVSTANQVAISLDATTGVTGGTFTFDVRVFQP